MWHVPVYQWIQSKRIMFSHFGRGKVRPMFSMKRLLVCWKCIRGWEHTPGKCVVKGGYLGDVPSAGNAGEEHSDAGVATKAEWAVQLQSEN